MKVFDVSLNDRQLCRAGVGADGVLTMMVTWVKLTGQAAKEARRLGHPLDETRMHVGGLRKNTHFSWADRHLRAGDRVTIGVTEARTSDPPARQKRNDPTQDERREREYYLRLKRKYDGHQTRVARSSRADPDSVTTLLNVDLDIWSTTPLDDLVRAFGRRVFVLYAGKKGRRYAAHLELARDGASRGADALIRHFVALVRRLPPKGRALWNRAQRRDFNVGIQAAAKPYSYELPLEVSTVRAAAAVNARVVFTVYGDDSRGSQPRVRKRRGR
jgi:hypothetical protein